MKLEGFEMTFLIEFKMDVSYYPQKLRLLGVMYEIY